MFLLLTKLFVKPFYKAHLLFYGFLFMACFGLVTRNALPAYHLFIIRMLLTDPAVLAGVMLLWLSYNGQCFRFCKRVAASPEAGFLYELSCLSNRQQGFLFLGLHLCLLAPFLAYAVVFTFVAFQEHHPVQALLVLLFWVGVLLCSVFAFFRMWNSPWQQRNVIFKLFQKPIPNTKNLHFIFFYYLHVERRTTFLLLKTFAFALLYGLLVWNAGSFGRDIFVVIFQLVILAHTPLVFDLFRFVEQKLPFVRTLPLRTVTIAGWYLFAYSAVLLPELSFMFIKQPAIFSKTDLLLFYFTGVMTLFLVTAILYSENLKKEDAFKVVFMLFFIATFPLNAGNCAAWLSIISVVAILLFFHNYPNFSTAA